MGEHNCYDYAPGRNCPAAKLSLGIIHLSAVRADYIMNKLPACPPVGLQAGQPARTHTHTLQICFGMHILNVHRVSTANVCRTLANVFIQVGVSFSCRFLLFSLSWFVHLRRTQRAVPGVPLLFLRVCVRVHVLISRKTLTARFISTFPREDNTHTTAASRNTPNIKRAKRAHPIIRKMFCGSASWLTSTRATARGKLMGGMLAGMLRETPFVCVCVCPTEKCI